jgi:hypothetical protein
MTQFFAGPCDGERVGLPGSFTKAPWICVCKPKMDPRNFHLYVRDEATGDYRYAGVCMGIDHEHSVVSPGGQ